MRQNTFTEVQKLKQKWIWALLFGIAGFLTYGLIQQIILGIPFGNDPSGDLSLIISAILSYLILLLFHFTRLTISLNDDGIGYRFFPIHFRSYHYKWDEVSYAHIRKYNAIVEYGGWGFRLGVFGKGRSYTMSGNMGLQLILKNGKKVLFGTNKREELQRVLMELARAGKFDLRASDV